MASNRPTYLNEGWTSRGLARKKWALEHERCAYCGDPLPKGHRLYCSRECGWRFVEDPRYHRRLLLWSRIRAEVLWEHKTCQICGVNPSSEVDHIIEVAVGGDPFAKSNLQALCSTCHKRKTAKFLSSRVVRSARFRGRQVGGKPRSEPGLSSENAEGTGQQPIEGF